MSEEAAPKKTSRLRKVLRVFAVLGGLGLVGLLVIIAQAWTAMGTAPEGQRRARMEASPQWGDGVFENPQPMWTDALGSITGLSDSSDYASPQEALRFDRVDAARFDTPPASGLRVTWLGHSTTLLEVDGTLVLTDPVWGERTSPLTWLGPARWYAPLIELEELPRVDAVLISHDHYDHLDYPSIVRLVPLLETWDAVIVCPLGVAAHLEYWGVPAARIVELDWWDETFVGAAAELRLTMTPARHASGRHAFDQMRTLWAGYALASSKHRVFFSGDTGLFPGLSEIGEKLGPFDLTMIEVGAYNQAWPDWHLGPEQAVRAHQMVGGEVFMPVHWGLFDLAMHGWTEPIERSLVAAQSAGVRVATPRPGESFEPENAATPVAWWPEVPWVSGADYPIDAGLVDANSPLRE